MSENKVKVTVDANKTQEVPLGKAKAGETVNVTVIKKTEFPFSQ